MNDRPAALWAVIEASKKASKALDALNKLPPPIIIPPWYGLNQPVSDE